MAHAAAHSILPRSVPRSTSYGGRFGRIFGKLPPWVPPGKNEAERQGNIDSYVAKMMAPRPPHTNPNGPPGNRNIPAAYTYFGQFVDHDITFDPESDLTRQNDPEGLQNFRSPRLDLDSLYGRGPDDQPYLYDPNAFEKDGSGNDEPTRPLTGMLAIGRGIKGVEWDLLRLRPEKAVVDAALAAGKDVPARAIIGDPRNDENVIVSQLQLTFARLHNRVLRQVYRQDRADGLERPGSERFHDAQRIVRWFYQYVVWNDFVKRLVPEAVWAQALKPSTGGTGLELGFKGVYNWKVNPYIPVEFSVAAYRLGHSLIRDGYQVNLRVQNNQASPALEIPIFDPTGAGGRDLHGGRLLSDKSSIEWDWYLSMGAPSGQFPQLSEMIDTHLSRSVAKIPGPTPKPLALLNIQRGLSFNLPAGSAVARAMGLTPIALDDAVEESLWVYILKEAELFSENGEPAGSRLGMVGGTIVAAVFAGLLKGDPLSFVEQFPGWTPDEEPVLRAFTRPQGLTDRIAPWDLRDLVFMAGMPISPGDIDIFVGGGDPHPVP